MPNDSELLDALGGPDVVRDIVQEMYSQVFEDSTLAPYFEGVDRKRLAAMQYEFLLSAFGGPVRYTGKELRAAHAGKGIDEKAFSRFVQHFLEAVEARDIAPAIVDRIRSELAMYRDKIVGIANVDG